MENKKIKQTRVPLQMIALVFVFFVFLFFRGSAKIAIGDAGDPGDDLRGFAWSSNFGWISMNCLNTGTCATVNYGVKIQNSISPNPLNFIGHAWSPNAGWISFEAINPPDNYKFNSSCKPPGSCSAANSCSACFNPDDGKIYGWAKVLSLGNDGWISLGTTTAAVPYRVSVGQGNASSSFEGLGWNGNTEKYKGLGWISFNCSSTVPSACGASNYFVYPGASHPPVPRNLSAPNWASSSACGFIARNAILMWQFTDVDAGSSQTAFEVIVSSSTSSSSPSAYHSNKVISPAQQYNLNLFAPNVLRFYDLPYYWWVRVWDNWGIASNWVQFNTLTSGHTLTENNLRNAVIGTSKTFTTYSREFPDVNFSYIPAKPIADANVTSTDASFYSTTGSPTAAIPCDETNCQWAWGSPNAKTNSTPSASSTVMTFPYGNNMRIDLKVTDNGPYNYSCNGFTLFFVDKLPIWIEKKAQ